MRIRGSVDGGSAVSVEDTPGIAPFTGAVSVVLAEQPGTDIRFDNVNVEGTPEVVRQEPHGDQDARIALVRATAEKTPTPYGEVTSVFCQSENSDCVVTYSAPACTFWSVENVNGVDVATPEEDTIVGGAGNSARTIQTALGVAPARANVDAAHYRRLGLDDARRARRLLALEFCAHDAPRDRDLGRGISMFTSGPFHGTYMKATGRRSSGIAYATRSSISDSACHGRAAKPSTPKSRSPARVRTPASSGAPS